MVKAIYSARVPVFGDAGQWGDRVWPLSLDIGSERTRIQQSIDGRKISCEPAPLEAIETTDGFACRPIWTGNRLAMRVTIEVAAEPGIPTLDDIRNWNQQAKSRLEMAYPTPKHFREADRSNG